MVIFLKNKRIQLMTVHRIFPNKGGETDFRFETKRKTKTQTLQQTN